MCKLKSLIYRLVISKSVKVASSQKQGWQYGTYVRYGTPQFLLRSTVRFFCNGTGTVRLFLKGTGTVRWYAVGIKNP